MVSYVHRLHAYCVDLDVLILIVVDNGLVRETGNPLDTKDSVLILIVVDNGLVQSHQAMLDAIKLGLNPYCSGQWSRTTDIKIKMLDKSKS